MDENNDWDGVERRSSYRTRHFWIRVAIIWAIVFTVATGWAIRSQRNTTNKLTEIASTNASNVHQLAIIVRQLRESKASVIALQKSNCGLAKFLLTARRARWRTYQGSGDPADLEAVKGYETIVAPFIINRGAVGPSCSFAKFEIKQRPLSLVIKRLSTPN